MKKGLPGDTLQLVDWELSRGGPFRCCTPVWISAASVLDFHLLDGEGATVDAGAAPPDAEGLFGLTRRLDRHREPIRAAIESMNGARFVHDRLELAGWQVEIADAQKVKGLAPAATCA
jgi:hypothetical protein